MKPKRLGRNRRDEIYLAVLQAVEKRRPWPEYTGACGARSFSRSLDVIDYADIDVSKNIFLEARFRYTANYSYEASSDIPSLESFDNEKIQILNLYYYNKRSHRTRQVSVDSSKNILN
jgi:hypothetical protein